MATAISQEFLDFILQLGFDQEVANALWQGGIRLPKDIGSLDFPDLKKLSSNPHLENVVYPILKKDLLKITIAKKPFNKAIKIVTQNAAAYKCIPDCSICTANSARGLGNRSASEASNNSGISSSGDVTPGSDGNLCTIDVTGGNFVQSNIGLGGVTYNNTNTTVSAPADQSDMPTSQPRKKATSTRTDKDVYPVRTDGTRRALLLNIYSFRENVGMEERTGSDVDCKNMKAALQQLRFAVEMKNDKTAAEIRSLVQDFAQSEENENADMVAIYIGSHGVRDEQGHDTFVGSDGERVKFSEVLQAFCPDRSKFLCDKPKLFFLQFCRKDNGDTAAAPVREVVLHSDACGEEHSPSLPSDIFCAFATPQGCAAFRNTTGGSWFVTELTEVLQKYAHKENLQSMMTKVNDGVSRRSSVTNTPEALQISEIRHWLRYDLFFH